LRPIVQSLVVTRLRVEGSEPGRRSTPHSSPTAGDRTANRSSLSLRHDSVPVASSSRPARVPDCQRTGRVTGPACDSARNPARATDAREGAPRAVRRVARGWGGRGAVLSRCCRGAVAVLSRCCRGAVAVLSAVLMRSAVTVWASRRCARTSSGAGAVAVAVPPPRAAIAVVTTPAANRPLRATRHRLTPRPPSATPETFYARPYNSQP
jgi:hypothetical protein